MRSSPVLPTAPGTVTSTAGAFLTSSSQNLYLMVTLTNSTKVLGPHPYYQAVHVDYTMPSYDKAV